MYMHTTDGQSVRTSMFKLKELIVHIATAAAACFHSSEDGPIDLAWSVNSQKVHTAMHLISVTCIADDGTLVLQS